MAQRGDLEPYANKIQQMTAPATVRPILRCILLGPFRGVNDWVLLLKSVS